MLQPASKFNFRLIKIVFTQLFNIYYSGIFGYCLRRSYVWSSVCFRYPYIIDYYLITISILTAMELVIAKDRNMGNTIISCLYSVGQVVFGIVAWLTTTWRIMIRILYLPGLLLAIPLWIFMPESIRLALMLCNVTFFLYTTHFVISDGLYQRIELKKLRQWSIL